MNYRLVLPIILIILSFKAATGYSQDNNSNKTVGYGYLTRIQDKIQLDIVNPSSATGTIVSYELKNIGAMPSEAFLSPDGKWLVLGFLSTGGYTSRDVKLLDINTGAIFELGIYEIAPSIYTIDEERWIEWSPDSKFIGFNFIERNLSSISRDIYIYSIETHESHNFTEDLNLQYRFAWSHDGSKIAVLVQECSPECSEQNLESALEIWDIATKSKMQTFDIDSHLLIKLYPQHALCYLDWSPTDTYLSFMANCDPTTGAYNFHEVFIATLSNGQIEQISSNTSSKDHLASFIVFYHLEWVDAENLFIANVAEQGFPQIESGAVRVNESVIYNIISGQKETLSNLIISEWSPNPLSNEIAIRTQEFIPNSYGRFADQKVSLISLDASRIIPIMDFSEGCNLQWSPDGNFLSYFPTESNGILDKKCNTQGVVFVNRSTAEVVQLELEEGQTIVPLGWIEVE